MLPTTDYIDSAKSVNSLGYIVTSGQTPHLLDNGIYKTGLGNQIMDNANIDWKCYTMSYNVNGDQEKELAKVIHVYHYIN